MFLYYLINIESKKFYIGLTNNLKRRIKEHNSNNNHFTGRIKGEWKVLRYKHYENDEEAKKEERRLKKSKNKKYIDWFFQQSP